MDSIHRFQINSVRLTLVCLCLMAQLPLAIAQDGGTPVDEKKVREALGPDVGNVILGKPLKIGEKENYLVTVGVWKKQVHFSQVQGETVNKNNRFAPNPIRKYSLNFRGNFSNFVVYIKEYDQYSAMLPKAQKVLRFELVSQDDSGLREDILVLEKENESDTTSSALIVVGVETKINYRPLSSTQKILDWSIDLYSAVLVVLVHEDVNNDGVFNDEDSYTTTEFKLRDMYDTEEFMNRDVK